MSDKREHLIATAERLFHAEGFFATGIERVIAEADVARMTLYKHFASKDDLVVAVLARREAAYLACLDDAVLAARKRGRPAVLALCAASGRFLQNETPRGCLFLKAMGEYGGRSPRIARVVAAHKQHLLDRLKTLLVQDGFPRSARLEIPVLLVLEGATACAQIMSPVVVAKRAQASIIALLANARPPGGTGAMS